MKLLNCSPRLSWPRCAAFTLIELLVVISIIAVLAGLLLPVVSKVTENARKTSAKATETQIVSAVNNFQTDYGQYPVAPPAGGTITMDTTYGTSASSYHNNTLFAVLRATETSGGATPTVVMNTRNIVYFEGKNVKNEAAPKDGFTLTANGKMTTQQQAFNIGDFVDPWGNAYFVCIDTNYNNVVTNPYKDQSGAGDDPTTTTGDVLRLGVIAYSFGLDGKPGANGTVPSPPAYTNTGTDDVVSWE